jgi:hypothetical protein
VDPKNGNTLLYRVDQLELDVEKVTKKIDRLTWALVSLSISFMSVALSLTLAVMATKR